MINRQSIHFMAYFMRAYPLRSLLGVGCLLLAGLLEGIGLAALLPLLELAMNADSNAAMSPLGATVLSILRQLHLNPSLATLLGLIVIGMTLKNLSTWYAMQQVGYTVAQVANDLRLNLIDSLLRARWNFFTRHPSGYFANGIAMEALRASMAYQ
ncbi:MAG: ABC transporter ATP-binding protein, partial [Verrucomicrobia bacterium]|nr:ABC transporter ATP-binding protein [Verrucomicrobiota bacterium]